MQKIEKAYKELKVSTIKTIDANRKLMKAILNQNRRRNMKTFLLKLSTLSLLAMLASCGGGGSPSKATSYGVYKSPTVSATQFVSSLNSVDGTYSTSIQLYSDQTLRSTIAGQDDWFVIYDAKFGEYKAVSLQYIRSLTYYDYYSNNNAVASEFRSVESSDIVGGKLNGDYYGDNYEVVDLQSSGYYSGRNSGYLYEDEVDSKDVSLMAKEQEQKKFFSKASKISFVYNLSIETSLSMVTLGAKVEKMLSRANNGDLTEDDQLALQTDLKKLTGVSMDDIKKASESSAAKEDVLAKIAAKIGTSSQNLEQKIYGTTAS